MKRADGLLLVLMVVVLSGVAVAARHATQDAERATRCADNLSQLWKMEGNYRVQFGGTMKRFPTQSGEAFWLHPSTVYPDIVRDLKAITHCPFQDHKHEGCDYRGPYRNVNDVKEFDVDDPVGADVDGNHGEGKGGNVLLMSGDVRTVKADDALWRQAAKKTAGGNRPGAALRGFKGTPKQVQAWIHLTQLSAAVQAYTEIEGTFPSFLRDLVERPKDAKFWPEGGYLLGGKLPKDPWGHDYHYVPGSGRTKIWSWGADGKSGGEGEDADLIKES